MRRSSRPGSGDRDRLQGEDGDDDRRVGDLTQGHRRHARGSQGLRIEANADDKNVAVARAQAVRDALVKAYGIDAGRLQAEGYKKAGDQSVDLVQL